MQQKRPEYGLDTRVQGALSPNITKQHNKEVKNKDFETRQSGADPQLYYFIIV